MTKEEAKELIKLLENYQSHLIGNGIEHDMIEDALPLILDSLHWAQH